MVLLESLKISMGEPAKAFNLKGVDEKIYTLENFKNAKALVLVFMCNHCPYVKAVWQRLIDLQEKFKSHRVQFVGINANAANLQYEDDSFENMQKEFAQRKMNFPYLIDADQKVAREYKAQCTPDIYVYDEERKLAYHGRIDDNWKDENKVTKKELADAIEKILKGEKNIGEQHPSMGCSIKWLD
ncbi:thioredoxin family protein [Candidatus Peregrinibacteria bacterium]|nr:thioredoxin family protein [Candidatus Peregrinibacteria bacterium]MBI5754272.1 thioredoxin family protein [Candidatus Peregrinibacteria bacterium]